MVLIDGQPGASGGVINITTKDGSIEPVTNLNVAYGSFATKRVKLSHSGSAGKL